MREREPAKKPTTWTQQLCIKASHVLCGIIFFLLIAWTSLSSDKKGLGGLFEDDNIFAWHPMMMTLGMVICFTQAMLAYRAYPFGKTVNKRIHMVLQTFALVFVCLGLWAVFKYHNDNLIANLYSAHSWLGIVTVLLFFQNYILGIVSFWFPIANPEQRKAYLPAHVYIGILTFVAAILTVESGITEKNAWLGCSYDITEVDSNPASHYELIPSGCKISNWLGMLIFILAGTTGVAVMNLGVGAQPPVQFDALAVAKLREQDLAKGRPPTTTADKTGHGLFTIPE